MATANIVEDDGDDVVIINLVKDEDEIEISKAKQEEDPSDEKLKVLVVGKNGSGKSTLINSFVGEDVIKIKDGCVAGDSHLVQIYPVTMCGVDLEFYDTKGFGDPERTNKKFLEEINGIVPDGFNLVLVCVRMDEKIDQSTVNALLEVSNVYGGSLWERAIFVITFANIYALNPGFKEEDGHEVDMALRMTQQVEEITETLHKHLVNDPKWQYSVKESVFREIPFCVAGLARSGNLKDRVLPTTQDWLQDLFVSIVSQSASESVKASKINQDTKRVFVEAGSVGSSAVVGGVTGAFIGGAVGTVFFPGVGTVLGAGVGTLIGGGIGTTASGGTVIGLRLKERLKAKKRTAEDDGSSESRSSLIGHSKQLLAQVRGRLKRNS